FPAQPGDSRDMLYSYMVNPDDGVRYLMIVNNQTYSNQSAITHTVNFSADIAALTEVSNVDGSYMAPVDLTTTHKAEFSFDVGEGRLFRLDYESGSEPVDDFDSACTFVQRILDFFAMLRDWFYGLFGL
ncbi:MAG: hypothetical protein FWF08_05810, partial [Oscillospiraceae bacterium]|nr:hypothetical protein [Oscillospiraceae bacterium]